MKKMNLILFVMIAFFVQCTKEKDPCDGVVCLNSGTASSRGDDCICTCTAGYEGSRCETKTVTKLVGNYAAIGNWTSTDSSGGMWQNSGGTTLSASSSFPDRMQVTLFSETAFGGPTPYGCTATIGNVGNSFSFFIVVSGNALTIPSQLADGHVTITGQGSITTGSSNISVTLHFKGSSQQWMGSCTTDYSIALNKL